MSDRGLWKRLLRGDQGPAPAKCPRSSAGRDVRGYREDRVEICISGIFARPSPRPRSSLPSGRQKNRGFPRELRGPLSIDLSVSAPIFCNTPINASAPLSRPCCPIQSNLRHTLRRSGSPHRGTSGARGPVPTCAPVPSGTNGHLLDLLLRDLEQLRHRDRGPRIFSSVVPGRSVAVRVSASAPRHPSHGREQGRRDRARSTTFVTASAVLSCSSNDHLDSPAGVERERRPIDLRGRRSRLLRRSFNDWCRLRTGARLRRDVRLVGRVLGRLRRGRFPPARARSPVPSKPRASVLTTMRSLSLRAVIDPLASRRCASPGIGRGFAAACAWLTQFAASASTPGVFRPPTARTVRRS